MIDSQPTEGLALVITKPRNNNFKCLKLRQGDSNDNEKSNFSKNKENVWCSKKLWRTKETCWKLYSEAKCM